MKKKDNIVITIIIFGILMLLFISFLLFKDKLIRTKPVSFDQASYGVNIGESIKIKYDSNNKEVVFYNSNDEIIDIDENGLVTAKKIGESEVKVCLLDNKNKCDTAKVIVFDNKVEVEKIIFNHTNEELFVGNSIILDVKVEPANASNKKLIWTSSNPEVAYIDNSIIYAKSIGTAIISATSNNVSSSVTINVVKEKNIVVTFIIQDSKAINKDKVEVKCLANENNRECNIDIPKFNVNNGYEIVGFSTTPNNAIIKVKKDEKINVKNNMTYYVITKNKKAIEASFIIQNDTAELVGDSSKCYFYNGNDTCEISAPNLIGKDDNIVLGWNTDKDSHEASVKVGDIIKVNNDTKLYSITKKEVNVTFNENDNIDNVNIKATNLSFNNNKYTKCDSYNGNGCTIKAIPIIYSKGNIIHGFSLTKNGLSVPILNTKFNKDITLYARIHNDINGKDVDRVNVFLDTQIGNINIEIEKGLPINISSSFINFLKELYKEYPELFYFDGKIVLLTDNTYTKYNGDDSVGITWTDDNGIFSTTYIRYNEEERKDDKYLDTTIHEMGHAYDEKYNQLFGNYIEEETDIKELFNKYKNMKNRPLSDYAYKDISEFVSEAILELYKSNKLEEDIKVIIKQYLEKGREYYKEIGLM